MGRGSAFVGNELYEKFNKLSTEEQEIISKVNLGLRKAKISHIFLNLLLGIALGFQLYIGAVNISDGFQKYYLTDNFRYAIYAIAWDLLDFAILYLIYYVVLKAINCYVINSHPIMAKLEDCKEFGEFFDRNYGLAKYYTKLQNSKTFNVVFKLYRLVVKEKKPFPVVLEPIKRTTQSDINSQPQKTIKNVNQKRATQKTGAEFAVEIIIDILSIVAELYAFFNYHKPTLFAGAIGTGLTNNSGYMLSALVLMLIDLLLIWLVFFIIKKVILRVIKKHV